MHWRNIPGVFIIAGVLLVISAIVFGLLYAQNKTPVYSGPPEHLRIALSHDAVDSLFAIAKHNRYFEQNGLDIQFVDVESGVEALNRLLGAEVDIAPMAEFPFVKESFVRSDLRIIGSLATVKKNVKILARTDAGIHRPEDLTKKKIGVTLSSSGEYYLSDFLDAYKLRSTDITMINLPPDKMPQALQEGRVSAIVTWDPFISQAATLMGTGTVMFDAQSGQPYFFVLVATEDFAKSHREGLERFLSALLQAEDFQRNHPEESRHIVAVELGLDEGTLAAQWPYLTQDVLLEQRLVWLMENEAAWAIKSNTVKKHDVPNYLSYIYFDALESVKPNEVQIMH